MKYVSTVVLAILAAMAPPGRAQPVDGSLLDGVLLSEAEADLEAQHESAPEDDPIALALGTTRTLRAMERVGQFMHRHGFEPGWRMGMVTASFFGPPVPVNMEPEPVTMQEIDAFLRSWVADLEEAERTLASVDDPDAKLRLRIGRVRFDFDADGEAEESEALWRAFGRLRANQAVTREQGEEFEIAFDRADAAWMRGYAHLMIAASDLALGYDYERWLDHVGHFFFRGFVSPYPFLQHVQPQDPRLEGAGWIGDVAAMIHLIDFPVRDAERIREAIEEVRSALSMSRQMVEWARAEEDDDREWVPAADQRGVFPNMRVSEEQFDAWVLMLDEIDAILAGEKLAPFWRGADAEPRGVNVRRVFTEPREFDLVLWVQGTAAAPYLEEGEITEGDVWSAVAAAFGWQFPRYAAWFN